MTQRYVVFMLNRRVSFIQSPVGIETQTPLSLSLWNPDKNTLKDLPIFLRSNPDFLEINLYSDDIEGLWIRFCMNYFEVASAGGLVMNQNGKALWINRNNHWDLPKGKIEPGESIEDAALREVKEETGIGELKIIGDLVTTYHTYDIEGIVHLKTTFWYAMEHSGGDTVGTPQLIEGITEVKWMSLPVDDQVWDSTYGSIRIVIDSSKVPTQLT